VKLSHLSDAQQRAALREAKYLGRLMHPNVIAYVTSLLEERKLHIIMEYADRGDLADKIQRRRDDQRPISEPSIMCYFIEIAQALEYVHKCNILHRDVKPKNIFLTGPDEQVKLGDFGVARIFDEAQAAHTQIGTPYYIAPEVLNMDGYGTKSELWSLGVIAYELMALRVPFKAPSLPGIAMAICGATPEPPPQSYSKALRRTTMLLLEKEPEARPALKDLLRTPRDEGDLWALEVNRIRRKLQPSVSRDSSTDSEQQQRGSVSGARRRCETAPQEGCMSQPGAAPTTARGSTGGESAASRPPSTSASSSRPRARTLSTVAGGHRDVEAHAQQLLLAARRKSSAEATAAGGGGAVLRRGSSGGYPASNGEAPTRRRESSSSGYPSKAAERGPSLGRPRRSVAAIGGA